MGRKRDRTPSSDDTAQSMTKRRTPDKTRRLERKREHDRAAQRVLREKTRNRIAQLEALVQALQADNEADGKIGILLAQLDEKTAEVNRLRTSLESISRIANSVRNPAETQSKTTSTSNTAPATCEPMSGTPGIEQIHDTTFGQSPSNHTPFNIVFDAKTVIFPDPLTSREAEAFEADCAFPPSAISNESVLDCSRFTTGEFNDLSISQIAFAITGNANLEGRLWYLAGTILNHILKLPNQPLYTTVFDEDIAIRAVIEGWSAVMERYPLDRGWQWLKELDETIYFNSGKPERVMHLRNCRLQFLHQMFPESRWNKQLPAFFTARPSQRYLHHDPLIEHFPWPSFRERLLFFPSKYATNKFMETLRRNLNFVWGYTPHELYKRDPHSALYSYSDTFVKHAMDIRCYSVKPALFDHFPELREDIPFNDASPFNGILTYTPLESVMTTFTCEEYFPDDTSVQEDGRALIECAND